MKLSLAWIFDHIDGSWKDISLDDLVARFNTTTAEIEDIERVVFDLEPFSLARVTAIDKSSITLYSDEWQKEVALPVRNDAELGSVFLITNDRYATVRDLGCKKDGQLPAMAPDEALVSGAWKNKFEVEDYILEVDNKSITHRPDMWGHRGFAREIAALFDMKLKPENVFLVDRESKHFEQFSSATPDNPFSISIKAQSACTFFSGLYIKSITSQPSSLWMAHRIARTDNRPLNAIIDATNYVLLDLGQPMHAFDVNKVGTTLIVPRYAKKGETLALLDGDTIELTPDDLVITNGTKPMALAGIMGGTETGIDNKTTSIFLEAACFDAATIRRSALRFKKRTESSARFEKSLDAQQTVPALKRFVKLLSDMGVSMVTNSPIVAVGRGVSEKKIEISLDFIERLLGCTVSSSEVVAILEKLDFAVNKQEFEGATLFTVIAPSFRATKDVSLKEDIVEEIGRFHGYTTIKPELPSIKMQAADMQSLYAIRKIKQHMAYALHMNEVHSYALYDESFLQKLQWEPKHSISVVNPVSDLWKRLVTSLVPHLLRTVNHNALKDDELKFFEWNPIWPDCGTPKKVNEKASLAAVIYNRKQPVDFYDAKEKVQSLFDLLGLEVQWVKEPSAGVPWYSSVQSARLVHNETTIGYAGMVDDLFMGRVAEGNAFVIELNGDYLASYRQTTTKVRPLSKYQDVSLDTSVLVPLKVTVDQMLDTIKEVDLRITDVRLIDFFEKKEWTDKRSLTFRFIIQDHDKTLEKEDIDAVHNAIEAAIKKKGATVR